MHSPPSIPEPASSRFVACPGSQSSQIWALGERQPLLKGKVTPNKWQFHQTTTWAPKPGDRRCLTWQIVYCRSLDLPKVNGSSLVSLIDRYSMILTVLMPAAGLVTHSKILSVLGYTPSDCLLPQEWNHWKQTSNQEVRPAAPVAAKMPQLLGHLIFSHLNEDLRWWIRATRDLLEWPVATSKQVTGRLHFW